MCECWFYPVGDLQSDRLEHPPSRRGKRRIRVLGKFAWNARTDGIWQFGRYDAAKLTEPDTMEVVEVFPVPCPQGDG